MRLSGPSRPLWTGASPSPVDLAVLSAHSWPCLFTLRPFRSDTSEDVVARPVTRALVSEEGAAACPASVCVPGPLGDTAALASRGQGLATSAPRSHAAYPWPVGHGGCGHCSPRLWSLTGVRACCRAQQGLRAASARVLKTTWCSADMRSLPLRDELSWGVPATVPLGQGHGWATARLGSPQQSGPCSPCFLEPGGQPSIW